MKIIAGNSNKSLAEAICAYNGVSLADTSLRRFADREIFVEINENIRGKMSLLFNQHLTLQTIT